MPDERPTPAAPTTARLEAVYQELILEHYRRPRGRGPLDGADVHLEHRNPLCGDELELWVAREGDRVREARLTARGCSLSVASASMLGGLARGRTAAEVAVLRALLERLLDGDAAAAGDERLGDLRAFAGVARVPARRRCVLLAFEGLERALATPRDE